jgi:hypothetical protein
MNYFYLDGIERKGPYSCDEIKSRKLDQNTLILKEGFGNWAPLSTFEELLSKQETVETLKGTIVKPTSNTKAGSDLHIYDEKAIIKVPSYILLFSLYLLCILFACIFTYIQRKDDLSKLNNQIDELMKGKTAITDYYYESVNGLLYDVYLSNLFNLKGTGEEDIVKTDNATLAYKPFKNPDDPNKYRYEKDLKHWDLFKGLVQYYEAENSSFSVVRLERSSNTFTYTYSWSGDMAYKVPEYTHYKGISNEFFTSPGYDIPTYRPTVRKCYEEAAKFLTVEEKDNSYIAGSYSTIDRFEYLESDFYEINPWGYRYYKWSDTIFVDYGPEAERGYVIDQEKITRLTSRNDASVFTSQWIVWYKSYSNKFMIEPKKWTFLKTVPYILLSE